MNLYSQLKGLLMVAPKTDVRHCEFADADGYEADAAPIYCEGDV